MSFVLHEKKNGNYDCQPGIGFGNKEAYFHVGNGIGKREVAFREILIKKPFF